MVESIGETPYRRGNLFLRVESIESTLARRNSAVGDAATTGTLSALGLIFGIAPRRGPVYAAAACVSSRSKSGHATPHDRSLHPDAIPRLRSARSEAGTPSELGRRAKVSRRNVLSLHSSLDIFLIYLWAPPLRALHCLYPGRLSAGGQPRTSAAPSGLASRSQLRLFHQDHFCYLFASRSLSVFLSFIAFRFCIF